ncbi:hypothetical protein wVul_0017 [Wolbachia endosymbiont of Armadillidium vulgare str. wVulC]|nr:hypothetical protein wVul_0017 [Wolbachia endosymbiont of Armadillidium vulgare str. wVulC]
MKFKNSDLCFICTSAYTVINVKAVFTEKDVIPVLRHWKLNYKQIHYKTFSI